ncbi:hypothetical protein KR038_007891 [Drosophila bunnanda]|nr:hypothetical protein KR038_007891 [Drosophila bunnanda]
MAFLLFRIGLVAGAVYMTQQMGIWDSTDNTVLLFEDAKREIQPIAENLMDRFCIWRCDKGSGGKEVEVKPWRESMVDAWNDTVKKSFYVLGVEMPSFYHRFADDLGETIDYVVKGAGKS